MKYTNKRSKRYYVLAGLATVTLGGCASSVAQVDVDPWEPFNRSMFAFNDALDQHVARPLAKAYLAITPEPVDQGITRFFANLDDVPSAINNLLQFKWKEGVSDVGRFVVNSTLGILGFLDVATGMGMKKHDEDFGQTLGYWGIPAGPYLVLPVIGPSSARDVIGFAGDWVTHPIYTRIDSATISWTLYGIRYVDDRADQLGVRNILESAAFDPYAFLRDSYLQRRESLVYDGNPPDTDDFLGDSID